MLPRRKHGVNRRKKSPLYGYKYRRRINKFDVVNMILQITDGRPQPRRNYKPAKKRPNAADQFNSSHSDHAEVAPQSEAVRRVDTHNSGYPKLKDELDRRRSDKQVSVKGTSQLKVICEPKQLRSIAKHSKPVNYKKTIKPKYTNIRHTKPKRNALKQSCQYLYFCDKKNSLISNSEDEDRPLKQGKASEDSLSKSDPRNPSKRLSLVSMSSYNSFESLDHEPML